MARSEQVKKKHHYTPELYRANFTDIRGVLHVVSMLDGKRFETTPRGVGFEKHLYRPDVEGQDGSVFEDAFAEFEGEAAPVIRDIISKRALPVAIEQLQILFNFVAFQAVRTPAMRRTISAPISHTRRIIADIVLSSPERFAAAMRQAGQDPKQLSYESFKASLEKGMEFPVITEEYLKYAMVMMNKMLEYPAERSWSVLWSDRQGEQFIVSDHPVTVTWSDGRPKGLYGPGHGHLETDVTFLLGSSAALLGRFEPLVPILEASKETVAAINSKTVTYAETFVAASTDEFLVMGPDRQLFNAEQLIKRVKIGPHVGKRPEA